MLSLYIHIPFCDQKCKYCSFFVLPEDGVGDVERTKQKYFTALLAEIDHQVNLYPQETIRTIHIGGGTPFNLGTERLHALIDHIDAKRGLDDLEVLTIELNPNPLDEVMDFVRHTNKKYQKLFRLRYSFGIQSFDDEVLEMTGRQYHFNNLPGFFRELQSIKMPNNAYNFDFIAFGKLKNSSLEKEGRGDLWSPQKLSFFHDRVASRMADSFSLYTLELFPGSHRYYDQYKAAQQAQKQR